MKGRILGFTPSSRTGTIIGDDGARYGFAQTEWRSDETIAAGLTVDFEARGEEAQGVYPLLASAAPVGLTTALGRMLDAARARFGPRSAHPRPPPGKTEP